MNTSENNPHEHMMLSVPAVEAHRALTRTDLALTMFKSLGLAIYNKLSQAHLEAEFTYQAPAQSNKMQHYPVMYE